MRAGLDKLLRRTGDFPELPERMRRPAIFALLFWSVLVLACVSYAFGLNNEGPEVEPTPLVLAAVLAAVWTVLPWDPSTSRWRKLAAPALLLGTFAFGYLTGSIWILGLYAAAIANGVFLFGFRRGIAYAAAILAAVFVNYLVLLSVFFPGPNVLPDALALTAIWVVVAVFIIGVCVSIVEAVRRQEEARGLLAELRSSHLGLEVAHEELKRQSERARDLATSEERARVAREVHDSLGHHLTAINLQLLNAERFWEKDPARARERVGEAKGLALGALSEVRRSVRALKPPALEERSGAGALSALARSFEGTGPEVLFSAEGAERDLPEEVELTLYRAMQEGLTNAARHSNARRVSAALIFRERSVRLVIADDGVGAPVEALDDGFGLPSLGERVEAQGGSVAAGNRPEGGFLLEVELPTNALARRR